MTREPEWSQVGPCHLNAAARIVRLGSRLFRIIARSDESPSLALITLCYKTHVPLPIASLRKSASLV